MRRYTRCQRTPDWSFSQHYRVSSMLRVLGVDRFVVSKQGCLVLETAMPNEMRLPFFHICPMMASVECTFFEVVELLS
jgi:hypothetical protein